MTEYKRNYPLFSLCGLNCGLCPRYHTEGSSKCPGCGGRDFHLKHPACAVITCNKKNDHVEFCFQCSLYPCKKYSEPSRADSFITYKNVIHDLERAKTIGIERYQEELNRKVKILELLIEKYNDGKRKNFYCIAVNLMGLADLESIIERIEKESKALNLNKMEEIKLAVEMIESIAKKNDMDLKLRKP